MTHLTSIKTLLNDPNHGVFSTWLRELYPSDSLRFRIGHDPVEQHLEGCYTLQHKGETISRFAFYENPALLYNGKNTACFGSYECIDQPTAAKQSLDFVKTLAREKGYDYLIGPMEGSTWHNHRFTTTNPTRAFFTEPTHHLYYNNQFLTNGFDVISTYMSKEDKDLQISAQFTTSKHQIEAAGITIRNLDMQRFDQELRDIAELSNEAFKENFLFTPISPDEFVKKYAALSDLIEPDLVFIAQSKRGIEGFSFSIPDYFDEHQPSKTLILKSMARRKDAPVKGIGNVLAQSTIKKAKELHFERIIHAFMRSDNFSTHLSAQHAANKPVREYALYGIAL